MADEYFVLVGMMGSGKTTLGRALAERLDVPFEDTDRMLEFRLGRSIPSLFKVYGESAFRDHETSLLRSLEPKTGVLSTGGGIVVREENWKELRRLGKTIYLDVPFEVLKERLRTAKRPRPLLQHPDWEDRLKQLLEDRIPLYRKADVVLECGDREIPDAMENLWQQLNLS